MVRRSNSNQLISRGNKTKSFCSAHSVFLVTLGMAVGLLAGVNYSALSAALDASDIAGGNNATHTPQEASRKLQQNKQWFQMNKQQQQKQKYLQEVMLKTKQYHMKQEAEEKLATEKLQSTEPFHSLQYYMELSAKEGHDKERLLNLLRDNAGLEDISEKTYNDLPTWSQVTSMYGNEGRLIGKDRHCKAFLADGQLSEKFMGPAGQFNSGTNLLADTLISNCVLPKREAKYGKKQNGIKWQVPWGKHNPPKDETFRTNFVASKSYIKMKAKQTLPVVMIRDPFRWQQSMCFNGYTSRWPRFFRPTEARYHCPNLWPTEAEKKSLQERGYSPLLDGTKIEKEKPITILHEPIFDDKPIKGKGTKKIQQEQREAEDFPEVPSTIPLTPEELQVHHFPLHVAYGNKEVNFTRYYYSMVHLWNEWYAEYNNFQPSELPRLMIRMEDLLFFPDQVVPDICKCAGGELIHRNETTNEPLPVQIPVTSTKINGHSSPITPKGQKTQQTGYVDALIKYGNPATRFRGHSPQDLQYAAHYLDKELMKLFQYRYPAPEDSPMIQSPPMIQSA